MTRHELGLMVEENIGVSKMTEKFYKLTHHMVNELLSSNFTAAEWRIYLYLVTLEPFGDRYIKYEPMKIWIACKCSKATFYRAIAKFQELDLFDFQFEGATFRNTCSTTNITLREQKKDSSLNCETENLKDETGSLRNETEVAVMKQGISKMRQPTAETLTVQSFENPSDSLQTNTDFKTHTDHPPARSVCVNVDFDEETREYIKAVANCQESEYSPTPVEQQESEQDSIVEPTNPVEDKSSAEIDVLVYKPMIEKLGVRFEAVVKQLKENPKNIQSAIASLQEAKDTNQCKNPTGYLKKALIEGWMPEKQQYLAPLNASTKSPSQMSDEEWMIYLANTLTRERRNQLIRFTIPGALGERIAVLANGLKMSFAQAKQMTVQQFEQMAIGSRDVSCRD